VKTSREWLNKEMSELLREKAGGPAHRPSELPRPCRPSATG